MTTSGEKAVFPLLPTMLIVVAAADTAGVLGVVGVVDALVPLLPLQPTSTNAQTAETIEPTHSLALMIFMSLLSEIRNPMPFGTARRRPMRHVLPAASTWGKTKVSVDERSNYLRGSSPNDIC
jgi:hypothetical protein